MNNNTSYTYRGGWVYGSFSKVIATTPVVDKVRDQDLTLMLHRFIKLIAVRSHTGF